MYEIYDHFLENDHDLALENLLCVAKLIHLSTSDIDAGDYPMATKRLEDALKSLKELERLNVKCKQQHELTAISSKLLRDNIKVIIGGKGRN